MAIDDAPVLRTSVPSLILSVPSPNMPHLDVSIYETNILFVNFYQAGWRLARAQGIARGRRWRWKDDAQKDALKHDVWRDLMTYFQIFMGILAAQHGARQRRETAFAWRL
ncbi:hypothetical protein [Novosphingobium terrae]|uniref:hypothetical protein n=1 Tax=Novosphingobium terrae TaxID=2726189 RepID=UPI00197DEDE5|nr:hypothetical protein [Novosphingobium terrae]